MKSTKLKKKQANYEFGPGINFNSGKKPMNKKKKIVLISFITACSLILILGSFLAIGYSMMVTGTVTEGVYIGDVHLGGLTFDETKDTISDLELGDSYTLQLIHDNEAQSINISDVKYTIDVDATAQKAFSFGKGGNTFSKILNTFKAKTVKLDLLPVFVFDEEALAEKINQKGFEILGTMTDHKIEVIGEQVTITPGTSGYKKDPSEILKAINSAIKLQYDNAINVHFDTQYPNDLTIDNLLEYVSETPAEPTYAVENGEVKVIEGRGGYSFDHAAAAETLKKVKVGTAPVTIPCHLVAPATPAAEVQEKIFIDELGSYKTYHASAYGRAMNIQNAAGRLNNKIILPGEVFSFNDTVGKRTVENGFYSAPEYSGGQSVVGIGGGTCQVSTTLYGAVLYSDLEIVDRTNHSMTIGYAPFGQDATVADSGIDFKFKNNTPFPVKIVTETPPGLVIAKIVGTKVNPDEKVTIVNTQTGAMTATTTRIVTNVVTGDEVKREQVAFSRYYPKSSS